MLGKPLLYNRFGFFHDPGLVLAGAPQELLLLLSLSFSSNAAKGEVTYHAASSTAGYHSRFDRRLDEHTNAEAWPLGTKIMKAIPTIQIENERVVVTEWRFAPGAETGHHVHAHDYVVVPMTTGKLRLVEPSGTRDVELKAGKSYARLTGVAHNVVNINAYEFSFIEVELK